MFGDPASGPEDTGTPFDAVRKAPSWQGGRTSTAQPLQPAPSAGEIFDAGEEAGRNDRTDFESLMLRDGYQPILEALGNEVFDEREFAGRRYQTHILNPGDLIEQGQSTAYGAIPSRGAMEEAIAAGIRRRRAVDPKFLPGIPDTVPELRKLFAAREKERRSKALATLDRSEGVGGFLTGFAGQAAQALKDPLNVATLPIGGGGRTAAQIFIRETIINGALELAQQPFVAENRQTIGERLGLGEAAFNVVTAGLAGGTLETSVHLGAKGLGLGYDKAVEGVFNLMPEGVQRSWADKMAIRFKADDGPGGVDIKLTDLLGDLDNRELVDVVKRLVPVSRMTPEEQAAVNILERESDIAEASPFAPGPAGDAEHQYRIAKAIQDAINDRPHAEPRATTGSGGAIERPPAGTSTPAARPQTLSSPVANDTAIAAFKQRVRRAEEGDGYNERSGAMGPYQFTRDTWLTYYKRRFGAGGKSDDAIAALRKDEALNDQLMDDLSRDNAAILTRSGHAVTAGNLYLVHFLGPRAARVLSADPAAPIASLVPPKFIEQNPEVLGGGKSASQVIAWAHKQMGGHAASVPASRFGEIEVAGDDPEIGQLRAEAVRLQHEAIGGVLGETAIPGVGTVPLYSARLRPSEYGIDAGRFQFKSGGDADGVIDTLKGVKTWDPARSGRVLYWQDREGRYWIADGHQRSGLAKRLEAEGAEIYVDGMVVRESDGVAAEDARAYGALLNILNRSADPVDAAKVLRDLGFDADLNLPPNSALVRAANGLARLSHDAFGMVVNGHLSPDQAALIGRILPDQPEAHAAMADLLVKLDPANSGQAESIIRQALAAGMHREEQIGLFGDELVTSSLFLERAKVLEKGLARLRNAKQAFGTAAKEAGTLERVGSRIAREASEKEAQANAEAIEIIRRVAYSQGPVADALNAAAARLAAGGKLGDVADQWVDEIRKLDLDAIARGSDGDGAIGGDDGGSGSLGEPFDEGEDLFARPADPGEPSLVELEAASERFSDPDGPAVKQQADSLVHDFKATVNPDAVHPLVLRMVEERGKPGLSIERPKDAPPESPARAVVFRGEDGSPVGVVLFRVRSEVDGSVAPHDLETRPDYGAGLTVFVDPKIRRQGIATQMYAFAKSQGFDFAAVSGKGELTPDGAAFVTARNAASPPVDLSHLDALRLRLSHERDRLASAATDKERATRQSTVDSVEREIAGELKFLGIDDAPEIDLSDEQLLAELAGGSDPLTRDLSAITVEDLDELFDALPAVRDAWHDLRVRIGQERPELLGAALDQMDRAPAEVVDPETEAMLAAAKARRAEHAKAVVAAVERGQQFFVPVMTGSTPVLKHGWQVKATPDGLRFRMNGNSDKWLAVTGDQLAHMAAEIRGGQPAPHISDQVAAALEGRGFRRRGNEFDRDVAGLAAGGQLSDGTRNVTLRMDESGRYLERVEGFDVANDVDLREFANDPEGAIERVLTDKQDPAAAERLRQELSLRAASPMRPGAVDADGTIGLGLFDAADQPELTFRLGEEGGEISGADLLAELDADEQAIKAMKDCL